MLNFKNVLSNDMYVGSWRIYGSGTELYAENKPKGIIGTRLSNQPIQGVGTEITGLGVDENTGEITVIRRGGVENITTLKSYVENKTLRRDSDIIGVIAGQQQKIREGQYLAWSGGRWIGTTPTLTVTQQLENLTDVKKEVGTITQRTMLLGSGDGTMRLVNPEKEQHVGSGVLYYDTTEEEYKLTNKIVKKIESDEQVLRITKIDETEDTIDVLNLESSGVGNASNANDDEYLVWKNSVGAWMSENKIKTLAGNESSEKLITSSAVNTVINNVIAMKEDVITSETDIECSGVVCSGIDVSGDVNCNAIFCQDIDSSEFTLGNGTLGDISISSGVITNLTVNNKISTLSVDNLIVDKITDNSPTITTTIENLAQGKIKIDGKLQSKIYTELNVDTLSNIRELILKDIPLKGEINLLLYRTISTENTNIVSTINVIKEGNPSDGNSTKKSITSALIISGTSTEIMLKIIYMKDTAGGLPLYYLSYEEYA